MNQLLKIQLLLGVAPDGEWGPVSEAALADATGNQLEAIQGILGVKQDGIWGPDSSGALQAVIAHPPSWPFTVRVDGEDLVCDDILITCFGGGFDPQDKGGTASGHNTIAEPDLPGVSVAMNGCQFEGLSAEEHAALDGAPLPRMPWGTLVQVTINGVTVTPSAGIVDLGPGRQASTPGNPHALDLTVAAAAIFAGNSVSREQLARNFEARGGFRIPGAAKYLPS